MRTRLSLGALLAAALAVACLATGAGLAPAQAQEAPAGDPPKPALGAKSEAVPAISVTRIRGATTSASRLANIHEGALVLEGTGGTVTVPLEDTIAVAFATAPNPPRAFSPDEVEVHLWSGERLYGRIATGGDENLTIDTPLLGKVTVTLDHLEGLHFRKRLSEVVEPPEFGASRSEENPDTIHMVGGDRIRCTVESLGLEQLRCATKANDDVTVRYERMTALRLGQVGAHEAAAEGTHLDVILRDASRVTGTGPTVTGDRLALESVSGFAASVRMRDIVAIHVRSDAFRYLSDLGPPVVEVKPFWKPVAGDADKLYAPRMDRAWSGKPLRCGDRTWLKGVGVFSGTSLTWKLDGSYSEFRAHAGVDDGAGPLGGVVFEVWVDGDRKWTSGFVRGAGAPGRGEKGVQDAGRIPLTGAASLTLKVLPGDGSDPYPIQDHADWLGAMLVKSPGGK